jgi:uncharacterized heparinase superfamily protein
MTDPRRWLRDARRAFARLPALRMNRVPDAPLLPVRDPWPGDPARGARILRGELEVASIAWPMRLGGAWTNVAGAAALRAAAHSFGWLRDLRALGTDPARLRARALVAEWIATALPDPIANRADVIGARLTAWLGHYDFFAASADDAFRQKLMDRIVADAWTLSGKLPAEQIDARALTALKGLIAASVALPEQAGFLNRALKFLPQEIARQVLPDGCHVERSPRAHMAALQDLTEIRALLQASQTTPPPSLSGAIDRMALALRVLRHGDGGLALFNGSREENPALVEAVLTQAGRAGRASSSLADGGFQRLQAGRTIVLLDCGAPPPPGVDRFAHAGTLAMEISIGRDRLIVNCGSAPAANAAWNDALRATAAHSTLVIGDVNSAELRPEGLGRRPEKVEAQRQEAGGAHWLETSHDGYRKPFGAIHRRVIYVSGSGEDVRGEDRIESSAAHPFALRFHLHPAVTASLQQDSEAVLLRLPNGSGWRLRTDGVRIGLEESIYAGNGETRRSEQVVFHGTGTDDQPQSVKWALTKVG